MRSVKVWIPLGVVVVGCTVAACMSSLGTWWTPSRARISLERTPLSVATPRGFLPYTIHAAWPLLGFSLPEGPDGGTPGFPNLEIYEDTQLLDLEQFVEERQHRLEHVTPPRSRRVAGLEGVEITGINTTIYDFAGGGSGTGQSRLHSIAFIHAGRVYVCELEVEIEEPTRYESALYELCDSIEVASSR